MGLMQRRKGRAFEQRIATILRAHFPDAVVRRASQADRAHQSDVYVSGGPALLSQLWLEANDARIPQPMRKLVQSERDAAAQTSTPWSRYPVVVWHKLSERRIWATTRLWTLDAIRHNSPWWGADRLRADSGNGCDAVVTMELSELLNIVKAAA